MIFGYDLTQRDSSLGKSAPERDSSLLFHPIFLKLFFYYIYIYIYIGIWDFILKDKFTHFT